MAVPIIEANLTNIDNAESAAAWAGWNDGAGGSPTPQDEGDVFIQGTQAVSAKISGTNQNKGLWFDNTTGIDMTITGRHLYIWVAVTTIGILDPITTGGIVIKVASDAAGNNWSKWYVGGSDVTPDARFVRYVIDLNKLPSVTAGTPATLTSVRWFGAGVLLTGSAKAENLVVDRVDYGDGLRLSLGDATDPGTWEALFQTDDDINNKYGIIEKRSETYFVKGGIEIGDASGIRSTVWDDISGSTVVFEDPQYYNGDGLVSSINADSLYNILLTGNSTGTTDINFGQIIGSGDGRQGINGGSIQSANPPFMIDGVSNADDLNMLNFFGVNFKGAGIIQVSGLTIADMIGCVFTSCGEVKPNNAEFLNNSVIAPMPDLGVEMLLDHEIKQIGFIAGTPDDVEIERVWSVDDTPADNAFVDETDNVNSVTTGDVIIFPATEAIGDYIAFGSKHKFAKFRFDTGTAGTVGSGDWEYSNQSDGWAALSGVIDETGGFTITGLQDVTYDIPTDWGAISVHGETPLYYIRSVVSTVYTINPIGDQGFIADTIEHHINQPASGSYTFDDLEFFGHSPSGSPKWHVFHTLDTIIGSQGSSNASSTEFDPGPVTINNQKTLTLSNLQSDSEIRIYNRVAGKPTTERDGVESSSTSFDHDYNFEGTDIPVIIVIFHLNFKDIRLFIDLTGSDRDIPIQQQIDRSYDNP